MNKHIDTASNYFINLYTMLKTEIRDTELTSANIGKIVASAMKVVEVSELKGEQQKFVAKELILKAVMNMSEGNEKSLLLQLLNNDVIEDMIETIILATKGKLQINEVAKKVRKRCCPFF